MSTSSSVRSHRDLIIWQRGIELVLAVYEVTAKFPKEELLGFTADLRRAAVAIPAQIAQGHVRSTRKEFLMFLHTAHSRCAELETLVSIAKMLPGTNQCVYTEVDSFLAEEAKMINAMIFSLRRQAKQKKEEAKAAKAAAKEAVAA